MVGTSFPYEYEVAILKKYGSKYKLTLHNVLRTKGLEDTGSKTVVPKGSVNEEKLLNNLARTRNTIFELAMCNEWDLFCTFTLDKTKYDRYNLNSFRSDFTHMIRNLRTKYKTDIAYLLIPERHKDCAWHMHGFIKGLPSEELRNFTLKEKLPTYIQKKVKAGSKVYEWTSYRKKFGFCDLEAIRDKNKASSYVTKYITKDLLESVSELNHKSYYCSQGLLRAEEIKRGHLAECPTFDFENEYVKIAWFKSEDNITDLFSDVN